MHQLLWFIYRCEFSVGVVAVQGRQFSSVNVLTDYSYVYIVRHGNRLARCVTVLGPPSTSRNANAYLGGLYFNDNMISIRDESVSYCGQDTILVRRIHN